MGKSQPAFVNIRMLEKSDIRCKHKDGWQSLTSVVNIRMAGKA